MASRIASASSATFITGSVGPNVSSVMHAIEWSTSASTVGSKNVPVPVGLPPASDPRARRHRVVDVTLHDVALCLRRHRADVVAVVAAALTQAHLADLLGQLGDELVVDRLLDVDAFDRDADLPGVGEPAVDDAVNGPVEIGVGEHERRVLAAQFQAVGDQAFGALLGDGAAGPGGAGELDVVDVGDQCGAGLTVPGRQGEYRRTPISDQPRTNSTALSGVTSDGLSSTVAPAASAGMASRPGFANGKFHGVITPTTGYGRKLVMSFLTFPNGECALGCRSAMDSFATWPQYLSRSAARIGSKMGFCAGLAGLRLQHIHDVLGVVENPVLKLEQPFFAFPRPDRLPLRLKQSKFANLGGNIVR